MYVRIFILGLLILASCNASKKGENEASQKNIETHDKSWESKDSCMTTIQWDRSKKLKSANTSIKIAGKDVNINVEDFSLATSGSFTVLSSNMFTYADKISLNTSIDMKKIVALQANEDDILELTGPNYLDIENHPTGSIEIVNITDRAGIAILRFKGKNIVLDCTVDTMKDGKGRIKTISVQCPIDAVAAGLINPDIDQNIEYDRITLNLESIVKYG